MMNDKKKTVIISLIVIFCCGIMSLVDGVIRPGYAVKSAVKIAMFLVFPVLYAVFDKKIGIKDMFSTSKKGMKTAVMLCIPVYVIILGAYLILKDVFDFSGITTALMGNVGVNKNNFVWVALYISFANSLLEEFFFRGFAFLTLKKTATTRFAYVFSALAFATYHIAMMTGWFNIFVFILALAGLFIGGLIFNRLNAKTGNIYTSWFVHMFANFAINTIGFMLFGII